MKFKVTLQTNGKGLWSTEKRKVETVKIALGYINMQNDFGEIRVFFNPKTWNNNEHGLIYTDPLFLKGLRSGLKKRKFSNAAALAVQYSEQGMQGKDYVSFDVGKSFLDEFLKDLNK
jgi:hypothetical protein